MPAPDWYMENSRRAYPFVAGPTLQDQTALGGEDLDPRLTLRSDSLAPHPYRNFWIADGGFHLPHAAEFDPSVHSIRLVFIRWDYTSQRLYFEFRSDAPAMSNHRFVIEHDAAWFSLEPESRFITYFVPAISGSTYVPPLRSDTYVAPVSADVGAAAYGGTYNPVGTQDASYGWCFITIGWVSDWFSVSDVDVSLYPQVLYQIEPAAVQTMKDLQALSINLANSNEIELNNPCDPASTITVPVTDSAVSTGMPLMGNVQFTEGMNTSIIVSSLANSITINGEPGSGAGRTCDAYATYAAPGTPQDRTCRGLIEAINGVIPDTNGSFSLTGGTGVEIQTSPSTNTITIIPVPENRFICST